MDEKDRYHINRNFGMRQKESLVEAILRMDSELLQENAGSVRKKSKFLDKSHRNVYDKSHSVTVAYPAVVVKGREEEEYMHTPCQRGDPAG